MATRFKYLNFSLKILLVVDKELNLGKEGNEESEFI